MNCSSGEYMWSNDDANHTGHGVNVSLMRLGCGLSPAAKKRDTSAASANNYDLRVCCGGVGGGGGVNQSTRFVKPSACVIRISF